MRHTGAEEQGLAGLELYVVEQHGRDDAGVAGVVVGDLARTGRGRRRAVRRPSAASATVSRHLVGVRGEDAVRTSRSAAVLGAGAEQVHVRLEGVDAEGGYQVRGLGGPAEAAQAVEGRERADQLGLVVGVLVVAVRRVDRDAAALLVGVALLRLGEVGVDLEGERGAGGEQLEQEGQAGAEGADGGGAEFALGVGRDDVREGAARPALVAAVDARRGARGGRPSTSRPAARRSAAVPSSSGMAVVEPQA